MRVGQQKPLDISIQSAVDVSSIYCNVPPEYYSGMADLPDYLNIIWRIVCLQLQITVWKTVPKFF